MEQNSDLEYLRRAVDLSQKSLDEHGFPAAAILVRDGREVSFGLSSTEVSHDVTAHGEVQAIRAAGAQAIPPLTLYSSLEPCLMCLAASAWAGVTRIVYCCPREAVDPAYYVNRGNVLDTAQMLTSPPEIIIIDTFKSEVVSLIGAYERRMTLMRSGAD